MEIMIFIAVILAALVMEFIDASIGMGYGTVLTPLLLAFGYSPLLIVPSVLLSQAIGGSIASMFHHRYCNVDFRPKSTNIQKIRNSLKEIGIIESFKRGITKDLKIVLVITILGVIATIIGAFTALNIPKWLLNGYIGFLVLIIGLFLISKKVFSFSWKKIVGLGILASFNKGISGGGFGPVATGGQVIAGNDHKSSIGCTTLAEAPICIAGFLTYLFMNGLSSYGLLIGLSIGAFIGAPLGALLTRRLNTEKLKFIIGIAIILLGAWTLIKLFI